MCLLASAFGFYLYSLIHFIVGYKHRGYVNGFVIAFATFTFFAMALPIFDVPLRIIAGQASWQILELTGQTTNLFWALPENPHLILKVNGMPFHVAPECNGFGVITTSALVSLMLSFYKGFRWDNTLITLAGCIAIGVLFNGLRIWGIVLLAPTYMDHYDLMHEIVGTISFMTAIGTVIIFIRWMGKPLRESATEG